MSKKVVGFVNTFGQDRRPQSGAVRGALGLLAAALVAGCGSPDTGTEPVGSSGKELYVLSTAIWSNPSIPVCWETDGNDTEKGWVRDALAKTWELETNISFEGWGTCNSSTSSGIRIRTADEWPATYGLGNELDNMTNGMILNFWYTFTDGNGNQPFSGCLGSSVESCTRAIAVHEFGHALGFSHEQNRSDTPSTCTSAPQGQNGDTNVGAWELGSIMNYCNPVWNNDGNIAANDISGAQRYYGGPKSISAVAWGYNRIDTFVRDSNQALAHKYWNGSSWSGFEGLAGNFFGAPKVVSWGSGHLDAFVRGLDGAVWHRYFDGSTWRSWESLGGGIIGEPAVVSWGANRIDLFVRGTDNQLWTKKYDGSWSGWTALGGNVTGEISAVSWGQNRLDVFYRAADGTLWHHAWNGSAWGYPESLGGALASSPSAVSWGYGRIDVFARFPDNQLWRTVYDGTWQGWGAMLGGGITGTPSAVAWGYNRLDVFARSTTGTVKQVTWDGSNWSSADLGGNIQGSPTAVSRGWGRIDVFALGTDNQLRATPYDGAWRGWTTLGGTFY